MLADWLTLLPLSVEQVRWRPCVAVQARAAGGGAQDEREVVGGFLGELSLSRLLNAKQKKRVQQCVHCSCCARCCRGAL